MVGMGETTKALENMHAACASLQCSSVRPDLLTDSTYREAAGGAKVPPQRNYLFYIPWNEGMVFRSCLENF